MIQCFIRAVAFVIAVYYAKNVVESNLISRTNVNVRDLVPVAFVADRFVKTCITKITRTINFGTYDVNRNFSRRWPCFAALFFSRTCRR
jgi:hypothetical protein